MSYVLQFDAMMAGFQVFEDPYAPVPTLKRYPRKGPYFHRRLKRAKRDPDNWTEPQFFILKPNTIVCHPSLTYLLHKL